MKIINSTPFRLKVVALAIASSASTGYAFNIETGNRDVRISFDNTVKYSAAARLKDQSDTLTSDDNYDDGNNNFDKGLVSNRLDLLSEFDASYDGFGVRISGAAWYDDVYQQDTDNMTSTNNNYGSARKFSGQTKDIMGGGAELLDAFVYGRFPVVDGMEGTLRVGRHSLLWGESLFFGANGIAGTQGPVDVVKLMSVPNSQFKETMIPTGKVSVDLPVSETVSVGAYYAYEWQKSQLQPAGAYLSSGDSVDGDRILAGTIGNFDHSDDVEPSDSGQYGVQVKFSDYESDIDYGLYAIRFHAYAPSGNYTTTIPQMGPPKARDYRWAYAEGIEAYGFSMSKTIGGWGWAGEVSYRTNSPLGTKPQGRTTSQEPYNNNSNPGYAIGDTAHAQVSWIASVPSFISQEASFVGELAWNTRVKTTENEDLLNPNADKSAASLRVVFTPTYRQAFDGVDLSPSIGASYTVGNSSALGSSFGTDKGGDINIGVKALYLNRWNASLNYMKFYGPEGVFNDDTNSQTYKQSLKDRDFISASISTTF
ncbi:DUF1302 domain-containing protein [Marinomonas sp. M1K-6]|uniref:DUF1302 domain-containing protein n=1 Tax=Marinomonas profundi TaxID=2726122 RepID=A0A847R712_9GAMM|nr:DUF1302 family protein [Marinomonas profundi]NLQ18273.1 DUF1302 domain-containing protein [Marinomonas profundi]UDV02336.1 DUF1302 family protein [Marinomonas profundi]